LHTVEVKTHRSLFGRRISSTRTYPVLTEGWDLGEFSWESHRTGSDYSGGPVILHFFLTESGFQAAKLNRFEPRLLIQELGDSPSLLEVEWPKVRTRVEDALRAFAE
jgi:hypothetical protein